MKNWGYKFKFIFSEPTKIGKKIVYNYATIIGSLYTFVTIADTVQNMIEWTSYFSRLFLWISIGALVVSLCLSVNWIPQYTCKLIDYDVKISLLIGDITKCRKSFIMSTNSSFVTTMENEIISPQSVQGAFQNLYFKDNLIMFEEKIKSSLADEPKQERTLNLLDRTYPIYEIGTTAKIRHNDRWVYMVALNDINNHGQNCSRKAEDLYTALNGLWTFISEKGNNENEISIPLLASGRAGIVEITKERAIESIIDTFIVFTQNSRSKITGHLKIVIYPPDLETIDVKRIKDYLKYKCLFTIKSNPNVNENVVPE